ncbi:toprim domain-containing protein [Rhodanobacter sp. AS-Z3]|uniref:toprim domain-containing protein n=1 Tax=Rhodanobacter sp. AS-Z3 TaxID=3031330 RepID=UPI002478A416|nr:toprim domain-containing protein [Rhodanobacter sp. AS-Z3]WEN13863.1 toprim domain-containing protein [Rhodanobacter sp. AS-Z3]
MSHDLKSDVIAAMARVGVNIAEPDQLRMTGVLCRFATSDNDRHGRKRNGWAVIFADGERPVVTAGDWAKNISEKILLGGTDAANPAERERQRIAIEQAKAARSAEIRKRQADAMQCANSQWNAAEPASEFHPYLMKKQIKATGLRESRGKILVPMRDSTGHIRNLQRIRADGQKRFLPGGRTPGLYASFGCMVDHVLIAEGYATAATLYEKTGLATVAAFSAGNLLAVAQIMRKKFPSARITMAADNDEGRPDGRNVGVMAATAAAAAVGGYLLIPPVAGDWNDFFTAKRGSFEQFEASNPHASIH